MNLLFIDTETTGFPLWKLVYDHPKQPRMVQLAAIMCSPLGEAVAEFSCAIKPDGWMIPDEAAKIHGITTAYADAYGLPIADALRITGSMLERCEIIIAHNVNFDLRILTMEYLRSPHPSPITEKHTKFCTMEASTDIVAIPSPNYAGQNKWPKLQEAYKFFFKREMIDSHDALADVRACAEIYFELRRRSSPKTPNGEAHES